MLWCGGAVRVNAPLTAPDGECYDVVGEYSTHTRQRQELHGCAHDFGFLMHAGTPPDGMREIDAEDEENEDTP